MTNESAKAVLETYRLEAAELARIPEYLDEATMAKAVEAICKAEKVITCACGHSGIAAKHFAHGMSCVDKPGVFLSPAEAVHGGSGVITDKDVVLFISRGGKTGELLPIIDIALGKGATVIAITENLDSPLGTKAHIVLPMQILREVDKYNMMATTSFAVTVGILDALWMGVLEESGFRKEQFGVTHPGGAVGARLNGKQL